MHPLVTYQSPSAAARIRSSSSTGFIWRFAGGEGSAVGAGSVTAVASPVCAASAAGSAGSGTVCGRGSPPATGSEGPPSIRLLARLLAHAGRLADLVAQVVELRPADVADARHVDLLDARRVHGERSLDEHLVEGLLAHGEGLADALALPLDADALEHLDTAAG